MSKTDTRRKLLRDIAARADELALSWRRNLARYQACYEIVSNHDGDDDGHESHIVAEHYAATGNFPRGYCPRVGS